MLEYNEVGKRYTQNLEGHAKDFGYYFKSMGNY